MNKRKFLSALGGLVVGAYLGVGEKMLKFTAEQSPCTVEYVPFNEILTWMRATYEMYPQRVPINGHVHIYDKYGGIHTIEYRIGEDGIPHLEQVKQS